MKRTILFIILLVPCILRAQSITTATLGWEAFSVTDTNTGNILSSGSDKLISHGSTSVDWQDAQGNLKYTYTVNTVNGTWSSVSNNGSIIYQITTGNKSGTITFIKSGSETTVRILVLAGEDIPDMYEFKISSITVL